MANLIFVRHAQTTPQPPRPQGDWDLTPEGIQQSKNLAPFIQGYQIKRVFTSDEVKAIATGYWLADSLNVPCQSINGLQETAQNAGSFYEEPSEFEAAVRQAMKEPDQLHFGTETFTAARERFMSTLNKIAQDHLGQSIVIVSHGRILALAMAPLMQTDPFELWQTMQMPCYAVFSRPDRKLVKFVPQLEVSS